MSRRPHKHQGAQWRNLLLALVVALSACGCNLIENAATAHAASCVDVQFVFARGSGEQLNDVSYQAWRSSIVAALANAGASLSYQFYELGRYAVGGYQYPAVAVAGSFDGYANLAGAYVSAGSAFDFGASVRQGSGELKSYLKYQSTVCPQTKFVLGGYSQGAMVLSSSLNSLNSDKILYVATFGDPKLYLPEGANRFLGVIPKVPDACYGRNLSNYRAHVPDCRAYEGVLGSYRPYQPESFLDKLGTWCNEKDLMCSSGYSLSDHTSYVSTDLYGDAARTITTKLIAAFPHRFQNPEPTKDSALHEIAFVVDSTRSMQFVINRYKAEAANLATRTLDTGGRISLFEYRDLRDGFSTQMHCDFSCDLATLETALGEIIPDGGGDAPESALSAMLTAMNSLDWTPGATKSLVLLTNGPFHNPDHDGTTLHAVVQRSLEIDPVNIYIIATPTYLDAYTELAARTNGQVFNAYDDTDVLLSTEAILGRPVANLALAEYSGTTGQTFRFDASASYALGGGELSFDWDLDGDGLFELENTGPVVEKSYSAPLDGFVQVKARLGSSSSTMSAALHVSTTDTLNLATIKNLRMTPLTFDSAEISYETDADRILLVVGDAVLGFLDPNRRSFTLGDLSAGTTVTLVPYSAAGRGLASTIDVSPLLPATAPNTAAHAQNSKNSRNVRPAPTQTYRS